MYFTVGNWLTIKETTKNQWEKSVLRENVFISKVHFHKYFQITQFLLLEICFQ